MSGRSILLKAEEIGALRETTLNGNAETLDAGGDDAAPIGSRKGKLLALGNGGSATDAMDVVADFRDRRRRRSPRSPGARSHRGRPILTAVANDIGVEEIFQRQVIAYGREGDALIASRPAAGRRT